MDDDPILYWHAVALAANKESHTNGKNEQTGPTMSARALAMVHLAMHDAYFGVNAGTFQTYCGLGPADPAASVHAAVAAAAYCTLARLFPSQRPFFETKQAEAPMPAGDIAKGHIYGVKVGEAIWNLRKDDRDAGDAGYSASVGRFRHRPDPDNPQGFHGPFYGEKPHGFAVSQKHELDPPPLGMEYLKALQAVRRLGIKPGLAETAPGGDRTPEETLIGIFWGYDGAAGLGTPPRLYNQIVLTIARKQEASNPAATARYARLLALVNVAMADAGIFAWREKYRHDFWRPVVGIREDDGSMGPTGGADPKFSEHCDPFWLPLGAPKSNATEKNFTPPFPAYPSGHATFGAAAFEMTRLFYGVTAKAPDNLCDGLEFVSDELNGVTRDNAGTVRPRHARRFKDGLWQAMEENGRSRVYLGVHWIFDAYRESDKGTYNDPVGGIPLGRAIAADIFTRHGTNDLRPSPVPLP